jgi:hypothetical protein
MGSDTGLLVLSIRAVSAHTLNVTNRLVGMCRSLLSRPLSFSIRCRFIGKLSDTIKSRKHPEVNLANRYLLAVATRNSGCDQEENIHPLVPNGAVHSIMDEQRVVWPLRTKYNSRLAPPKDPHHARLRVIQPILGIDVCNQYKNLSCAYQLIYFKQAVQVGRWTYGLKAKEDGRQVGKTRASWFRIRAKHVPHYKECDDESRPDEEPFDGEQFIFGRIFRFARLEVWREEFELAEVSLFSSEFQERFTRYHIIDLRRPLKDVNDKPIQYVQAKHLHSCVAVAPVHHAESQLQVPSGRQRPTEPWYVLPLDV